MDEYKVIIEEPAIDDLREIFKYISETLMEPEVAQRLIKRIRNAVEQLDQMPERCRVYNKEPWKTKGIRCLNIGNFSAFYIVFNNSRTVSVLAVIYSGRDIDNVLREKLDD